MERTIQHLIRNGFDTGAAGDPFRGLTYASIQEHATKTSWRQLGNIVRKAGAPLLHEICELPARYRQTAEIMDRQRTRRVAFPWIHGRLA